MKKKRSKRKKFPHWPYRQREQNVRGDAIGKLSFFALVTSNINLFFAEPGGYVKGV